ncbi:MAG: hypothetical protein K0S40_3011, partial [Actinomycetospora sp.]|nr:hypothetical protein [Actinomycetospora sp.]
MAPCESGRARLAASPAVSTPTAPAPAPPRRGTGSLVVLCGVLLLATVLQGPLLGLLDGGTVRTAATV